MSFLDWVIKKLIELRDKHNKTEVVIKPKTPTKYVEYDRRNRTMIYYDYLYKTMEVRPSASIQRVVERIERNKPRYIVAGTLTGISWKVIAVIHEMEASGNFQNQLLNGENWESRTRKVPRGMGPWTSWEVSCMDAFSSRKFKGLNINQTLKELERYNGMGYVRRGINSPYLWGNTNHYKAGKYVSDGKYSPTAITRQIGAAALLKKLGY